MKTKTQETHTPAPWKIGYANQTRLGYWTQSVKGPNGHPIHPARANGNTQQVAEANARLIAAAPELLEQLKRAVECLHDLNRFDLAPMLAAIEKAEGESKSEDAYRKATDGARDLFDQATALSFDARKKSGATEE